MKTKDKVKKSRSLAVERQTAADELTAES